MAGKGCDVWNHVTLPLNSPWYCLSFTSRAKSSIGIEGTEFLSKPEQVTEFLAVSENVLRVDHVLLASPPRLNRTPRWLMEPLAEVWRGKMTPNGFSAHAYILQDGRRYVDWPDPDEWPEMTEKTQILKFVAPEGS